MSEHVNTGGTISFHYPKGYNPKMTPEERAEMNDAWTRARLRKKREVLNRIIILGIIILLFITIYVFIR